MLILFLEKVEPKYIDLNFLKVIKIWKNFDTLKTVPLEPDGCLPIICLHSEFFI